MKTRILGSLLAAVLLVFHLSAAAEDIDLFVGASPAKTDLPNVLIILDNTANWGPQTKFQQEIDAMKAVLAGLPIADNGDPLFRVGFMLFSESVDSGQEGGYVRAAIRPLTTGYKAKLTAMLDSFGRTTDNGSGGVASGAMADAYTYFAGIAPFSGNDKNKSDYAGSTYGTAASKAVYAESGNALKAKVAAKYTSPVPDGSCGKNFIIYISNGPAQDNDNHVKLAAKRLTDLGGSDVAISLSPVGSQTSRVDEWARFMFESPLSISTYTVDIDKQPSGQGPGWTALLKSAAKVGGGENQYYDLPLAQLGPGLVGALNDIFSKIQSVNSVFAAVSLPVSVNTQGTFRNQVYIGMFRPDEKAYPRWAGNLKQYKLGNYNGTLQLLDSTNEPAINTTTGFIAECAKSFWSPIAVDTYWDYRPLGTCIKIANSAKSNYPDANIVDKGAQAYQLRRLSGRNTPLPATARVPRTVKTCSFASCTSLVDFNSTNVTEADVLATSPDEHKAMINWVLGVDVKNEHTTDGISDGVTGVLADSKAMRPSVHGDVVHSRPVAINFGTDELPKVVVFYGGNDGVLRAVNGNRDTTAALVGDIGAYVAGSEMWAFVPPEFYGKVRRIYDNTTKVYFPNQIAQTPAAKRKEYGMDGPVTGYKNGSTAYIYAGMRRGGRSIYAFNVNVSNPWDITAKWRIGCTNQATPVCTTGFENIGQTWTAPKTLLATGYNAGTVPLMLLSGGYDTCEDTDAPVGGVHACNAAGHTKIGNMVYVMDANTGELLQTIATDRAVVADPFIILDPDTGRAKYAYIADLGGNVYRVDIGVLAPGAWVKTKIASLGCDTAATCGANRKFLFHPDVVVDGNVNTLLIGSGDREKPLNSGAYPTTATIANYFFMFQDKPLEPLWLSKEVNGTTDTVCTAHVICKASLVPIANAGASPTSGELLLKKGWALALTFVDPPVDDKTASEQVVTSAITIFDTVTFSTHKAAISVPGSCVSSLGEARVYNLSYKDASSAAGPTKRGAIISGGGLPPSPVAGMVTLDPDPVTGKSKTVPFCIGCKPGSPLDGGDPPAPPVASQPKARIYWYLEK